MDFSTPDSSEAFRGQVRAVLDSAAVRAHLDVIARATERTEPDERPVYRALGEAGLLAPMWPEEYGGAGGGPAELCALAEEMARYDVPHTLHFISVQIVGTFLLTAGTPEQKRHWLPPMARGDAYACILFTEPDVGSDLASVSATARRSATGWVVTGCKRYNLKSQVADVALCALRTGQEDSRYQGLSLFLVPMDAPGVRVRRLPSYFGEHFHEVVFDEVAVGDDAVLGAPGDGWSLISQMMAGERSGLDYYVRGMRWLEVFQDALRASGAGPSPAIAAELGRHWARVEAGRWLALRVLERLAAGRPDVAAASLAKWHCSESAQQVGWWAAQTIGLPAMLRSGPRSAALLEEAVRIAPSVTISGGASEVLLETVAGSRLDSLGTEVGQQ